MNTDQVLSSDLLILEISSFISVGLDTPTRSHAMWQSHMIVLSRSHAAGAYRTLDAQLSRKFQKPRDAVHIDCYCCVLHDHFL